MNIFNFDLKKVLIIAVLLAIPLFSINMQQASKNEPWILVPFYFLSGQSQDLFSSFSSGVRSTTSLYLDLINIKKENIGLKDELSQLKAQLSATTELQLENNRLTQLLDFKQKTNMDLLAARIIGRDLFPGYNTVTINRGSNHGVTKNMATITVSGVVGYTIHVEASTSQVLLLTDRYAVVDALVQNSRARGLIQGHQRDSCQLHHLKRTDAVEVGDLVVTSGLDNTFPKGFPVGHVTSVEQDRYGLRQIVIVEPVVNPSTLEEVFVVLNAKSDEVDAPFDPVTENPSARVE